MYSEVDVAGECDYVVGADADCSVGVESVSDYGVVGAYEDDVAVSDSSYDEVSVVE